MDQLDHLIGSEIGNYTVVNILGQGSMGVVLHGRAIDSDEDVAIKLLAPELIRDEVSRERMARESRAMAKLSHPNIVSTIDFDSLENGRAYLVMEYVKGENLDDYLDREKTFPTKKTIMMALQLSNAMAFAHDEGIIHRDLKPQNIMLATSRGRLTCKILDFGIAKMIEDRKRLTRTGEVVGSPIFMSPEQCTGKKLDQRTDIYSLGIILFKCLAGKYPHHGSTLRDTFLMKTTMPCPRINEHNPEHDAPPRLENLIYKCLEIKPEDRYRTMADVYLDLRELAREYNLLDTIERSREEDPPQKPRPDTKTMMKFAQSKNLRTESSGVNKLVVMSAIAALIILVLLVASFAIPTVLENTKPDYQSVEPVESTEEIVESKYKARSKRIEAVGPELGESKSNNVPKTKVKSSPQVTQKKSMSKKSMDKEESVSSRPKVRSKKNTRDQEHDAWWNYRLKNEN